MDLESLLEGFCRTCGFPPIPVNATGQARLSFSGDLNVDLEWRPGQGGLYLTGVICSDVPDDPKLLRALLQANAPRAAAWRPPVLSLDPGDGALVVWTLVPESGVSEAAFSHALEAILETMEQWRHNLADGTVGQPGTPEPRENLARPRTGWNLRA